MSAEACGGDAEALQLDQLLSASRVGIGLANAVIAETRLGRPVSAPPGGSHDRLTSGMYLGRETCGLLYLRQPITA